MKRRISATTRKNDRKKSSLDLKERLDLLHSRYRKTIALNDLADAVMMLVRSPGDVLIVAELLLDNNKNIQLLSAKVLKMAAEKRVNTRSAAPVIMDLLKKVDGKAGDDELKDELLDALRAAYSN